MSEEGGEVFDEGSEISEQGGSEAAKVAASVGTKRYFLSQQARNLDEWSENASEIFRFTGKVFTSEYELKASQLLESYGGEYDDNYSRCRKEFDAYCILNRKVQKKNDEIENLANYLNQKNVKKNFFNGWKQYTDKKKFIRIMDDRSAKYYQQRTLRSCLKSWLKITMDNTKIKIKNEVLQKTEIEVSRVQTEYERLIKTLEQTLEKKLTQLKKEEEQHKLLHDKYEAMYTRSKVSGISSRQ